MFFRFYKKQKKGRIELIDMIEWTLRQRLKEWWKTCARENHSAVLLTFIAKTVFQSCYGSCPHIWC